MQSFVRLNMLSIIHALVLLIPIELMLNVHRIARLLNWDGDQAAILLIIISLIAIIIGTIFVLFLTNRWFKQSNGRFWTLLLWFPYFLLLIFIVACLFPMTNPGDDPGPGAGLILIFVILLFPVYVLVINLCIPLSDWKRATVNNI
ncbi:hypothetical protein [Gracilibacillus phocaeensis]|uniref:hypothetical protein n=1 Tax=Gracilibacillus phocaeensis TaxID=2042304 RepID=UPI0010317CD0|nr:hypothetical protein [Gracilibacillus phocaeensis]